MQQSWGEAKEAKEWKGRIEVSKTVTNIYSIISWKGISRGNLAVTEQYSSNLSSQKLFRNEVPATTSC